ncbi:MAG: DUF5591 domain-containing protein [Thermoplasmata archaeon]
MNEEVLLKGGVELLHHPDVLEFHNSLMERYTVPEGKAIALFLPCSAKKPYSSSRTHRAIDRALSDLDEECRMSIHELIVSEPLGIVPRELEMEYPAAHYNMVLKSWFPASNIPRTRKGSEIDISRVGKRVGGSTSERSEAVRVLGERVAQFLLKTRSCYDSRIGFVRSSHRQILERAGLLSNVSIEFIIDSSFVNDVIKRRGTFYWIMNGMRCRESMQLLRSSLEDVAGG